LDIISYSVDIHELNRLSFHIIKKNIYDVIRIAIYGANNIDINCITHIITGTVFLILYIISVILYDDDDDIVLSPAVIGIDNGLNVL